MLNDEQRQFLLQMAVRVKEISEESQRLTQMMGNSLLKLNLRYNLPKNWIQRDGWHNL